MTRSRSATTRSSTGEALVVERGAFRYAEGAFVACSSRLDLALRPGELCCVVGPVGSGKSTLIDGILGDAAALDGTTVRFDRARVALAAQRPRVLNASVRRNVTAFVRGLRPGALRAGPGGRATGPGRSAAARRRRDGDRRARRHAERRAEGALGPGALRLRGAQALSVG